MTILVIKYSVNLMLGVRLLKELKTSCMFVMESLYTIKMSSTYRKYLITDNVIFQIIVVFTDG